MPSIRADIVDVYIARESRGVVEFLQLHRTNDPLADTWQPVMGHVEREESVVETAVRELGEEVGLCDGDESWLGFWQLEDVHPYFVARLDAVLLSPRLLVEVVGSWTPDISGEQTHDDYRWVCADALDELFMWPGQVRACREAVNLLATRGSAFERALRLGLPTRSSDEPDPA